jgi:glycogen phosphorylase
VRDYALEAYIPASDRFTELHAEHYAKAKSLSSWKETLEQKWHNLQIKSVDISEGSEVAVNQPITVKAEVYLAGLASADIQVELYQGEVAENGHIVKGKSHPMQLQSTNSEGLGIYQAETSYAGSGLNGLALRILPKHPNLANAFEPRLIQWAK